MPICPRCGDTSPIVNECGCDPHNLPTRPLRRTVLVVVSFSIEPDPDDLDAMALELPSDEEIASALTHSTAAEALAEATGCSVSMWIHSLSVQEGS